jgi:hypothetical protein
MQADSNCTGDTLVPVDLLQLPNRDAGRISVTLAPVLRSPELTWDDWDLLRGSDLALFS